MSESVVILGFDGSAPSERALQWAADAAMDRGATLHILYAGPSAEVLERGRHLAETTRPELKVATESASGSPAAALIRASRGAALVVVGNRGHGGFHDLLLGSTSLQTAMHAEAPVAVIRPTRVSEAGRAGRIVVGVDGSEPGQPALDFALEEARRSGLPITAVHAWEAPVATVAPGGMPWVPDFDEQRRFAENVLQEAIAPARARYSEIEIDTKTVDGSVSAVLVQESMGAHLIVVGSRGAGGFAGLLLGSAGQALIHHAGCPVVVVHRSKR